MTNTSLRLAGQQVTFLDWQRTSFADPFQYVFYIGSYSKRSGQARYGTSMWSKAISEAPAAIARLLTTVKALPGVKSVEFVLYSPCHLNIRMQRIGDWESIQDRVQAFLAEFLARPEL